MTLILNPRPADIQTEGKTDITSRQRKQKDGQSETGKADRQTDRTAGTETDRQEGREVGCLVGTYLKFAMLSVTHSKDTGIVFNWRQVAAKKEKQYRDVQYLILYRCILLLR